MLRKRLGDVVELLVFVMRAIMMGLQQLGIDESNGVLVTDEDINQSHINLPWYR